MHPTSTVGGLCAQLHSAGQEPGEADENTWHLALELQLRLELEIELELTEGSGAEKIKSTEKKN